jgi:DNA-binding NtrC family response regulator
MFPPCSSNLLRRLYASCMVNASRGPMHGIAEEAVARTHTTVGAVLVLLSKGGQVELFEYAVSPGEQVCKERTRTCGVPNEDVGRFVRTMAALPQLIRRNEEADNSGFFFARSQTALRAAVMEDFQPFGFLQIETLDPEGYSGFDCDQIHALAIEAIPYIHRIQLQERLQQLHAPVEAMGVSDAFLKLERKIREVAEINNGSVVLTGERGSGKELAAWALHCWSDRHRNVFLPVLASALPDTLFLDELFGHERGAFTGAEQKRSGKLVAAESGTIFIDEVADLTPSVQSALLRFLDTGEVIHLGRDLPQYVNVRVIAASNQDLQKLVAEGRFRSDLYDRLSGFTIHVPPLRERSDDIGLLASHYLRKLCVQGVYKPRGAECSICQLSELAECATDEFYSRLRSYSWPGNIRQLKSVMLQVKAAARAKVLDSDVLRCILPDDLTAGRKMSGTPSSEMNLEAVIRQHIQHVLAGNDHNQTRAAEALGIPLSTLRNKMKKLKITVSGNKQIAQVRRME